MRPAMSAVRLSIVLGLLASACSADAGDTVDEIVVAAEGDAGKADGVGELRVRAGDTSLWVQRELAVRGDDNPVLVLHARTSRNLTDGRAFVFDDIDGDFAVLGARSFEVTWPVASARGLVDGNDTYLGLSFVPSPSRPERLTGHVVVRPRLSSFTGSSRIYLTAELTPVVVAGRVVYRLQGHANADLLDADARIGATRVAAVASDARHFHVDLEPGDALAAIAGHTPITVRVHVAAGLFEKSASLGVALHELGFTAADAYDTWEDGCTDDTLACLAALAPGSLDLGSCGAADPVQACAAELGLRVGEADLAPHHADVGARVAGAFAGDATALVGDARQGEFVSAVATSVDHELDLARNRWFLDATARDTSLASIVDGGFDRAYAFPLAYVHAQAPAPGDAVATRHVVADALLAYLAEQDYLHSEFGRSYLELVRAFRGQHLASLRAFREHSEPMTDGGVATYVGDWLGAYTEVAVDSSSGAATRVLVELD